MKRILIANRGEIARRVIRTAHAMGLDTVAVFSDPDAGALHVREARAAHALGGATSAESYLRVDKLLAAARATGADAIHPGYGFLSENADFAQAVLDAGLTWIGPPPAAIRALGSKAGAKALARQSQVPCLPGYDGDDQDDDLLAREAERIGWPVMIKAVAGGGGRGMRLVTQAGEFAAALRSARSEALAGFGDDRVLIERAVLNPRHVEVQVFADAQGHAIHLGERDCSVQRRHQKIIEEAPSPAVQAELRARMGECAVALAQAAGYVGAGTVEFLLEGEGDAACFYLMEMNTRLQVEHPVTEALLGQDLVAWQIRVARGEPLPWTQAEVPDLRTRGHAIEVRLCAEDEQFAPRTGTVRALHWPAAASFALPPDAPGLPVGSGCALRIDSGLEQGTEVTPHYDAMLAKLIVHAPTRAQAIDALCAALRETRVLGLHTNRAFLAACLDHPTFRAGEALVPFLQTAAAGLREQLQAHEQAALPVAAAALVGQGGVTRLPCAYPRPLRLRHRDATHALSGRVDRDGAICLERPAPADEATADATRWRFMPLSAGMQPLSMKHKMPEADTHGWSCQASDGMRHVWAQRVATDRWQLQTDTGAELWLDDLSLQPARQGGAGNAGTELRAPFNGRVIRVDAVPGATLVAGAVAVVIESMKLEHALTLPAEAMVAEVLVEVGQQVSPGQMLLRFGVEAPQPAA
ncbi:carbamoyl-phosphate synthase large subunit [Comamonas serinivorans]|uniref:Carbamoyl-phosphate synthase large subunit n=1 Tax=Comamonas serinivorans TaxID=1082851 RepID=A0A1Y0EQY2_9BURK|nr:biotin carboxylase N-terminal domain-containing protein [Comamonas serinivorans]ARU05908.1 carbamoyl-phosphate synthase large subunit [Comamonas serinivorans]